MRILSISSVYPTEKNITQAANLVSFEVLKHFSKKHTVGFCKIDLDDSAHNYQNILEEYNSYKIEVVEKLKIDSNKLKEKNILRKIVKFDIFKEKYFFPLISFTKELENICKKWKPDVIIVVWDELVTPLVAHSRIDSIKYAYYGNADYKVFNARTYFRFFFDEQNYIKKLFIYLIRKIQVIFLKKYYLSFLQKIDILSNVALNDTHDFQNEGIKHINYLPNMWVVPNKEHVLSKKKNIELAKNKIVVNIGNVEATANTLGLYLFAKEFFPKLKEKSNDQFEFHIIGKGKIQKKIQRLIRDHKEIIVRGFVDDIDREIMEAKLVLTLNNASFFKVCHTRYLHVFSLGTINIVHSDALLSMPELKNDENVLAGDTINQMVDQTLRAIKDVKLREKISFGGFEVLSKYYDSKKIVDKMCSEIETFEKGKSL
jgi:hypothetical protein